MGKKDKRKKFTKFDVNSNPAINNDRNITPSESTSYAQPKKSDITPTRNSHVEATIPELAPPEVVANIPLPEVSEEFEHNCVVQEKRPSPAIFVKQCYRAPPRAPSNGSASENAWKSQKLNLDNLAPDLQGSTTQVGDTGSGRFPPLEVGRSQTAQQNVVQVGDSGSGRFPPLDVGRSQPAHRNVVLCNMEPVGSDHFTPAVLNQPTLQQYDPSYPNTVVSNTGPWNVDANEFVPRGPTRAVKQCGFVDPRGLQPTNLTPNFEIDKQLTESCNYSIESYASNTEIKPAPPSDREYPSREQQPWENNNHTQQNFHSRSFTNSETNRGHAYDGNKGYSRDRQPYNENRRNDYRRDDHRQNPDFSQNRNRRDRRTEPENRYQYHNSGPRRDSNSGHRNESQRDDRSRTSQYNKYDSRSQRGKNWTQNKPEESWDDEDTKAQDKHDHKTRDSDWPQSQNEWDTRETKTEYSSSTENVDERVDRSSQYNKRDSRRDQRGEKLPQREIKPEESWDTEDTKAQDTSSSSGNVGDWDQQAEPAESAEPEGPWETTTKKHPKKQNSNLAEKSDKGYHQSERKSHYRGAKEVPPSGNVSKVGKFEPEKNWDDELDAGQKMPPREEHRRKLADPRADRERKSLETGRETHEKSATDSWNNSFNNSRRSDGRNSSNDRSNKDRDSWRKSDSGRSERWSRDSFNRSYEKTDDEYRQFQEAYRRNQRAELVKVKEIEKDLFEMTAEYSLGHCVAEDMRMGSGIAVNFKRDFKHVEDLLDQRQKQGGLAVLQMDKRFIYYLVTKRTSSGKPTYETFWSSLKKMRDHVKENEVKRVAIPRIGCGLDRLEWSKVSFMIDFLFRELDDVLVTVCNFQQTEDSTPQKDYYSNKLVEETRPLNEIEDFTIILYYATEDGHVSEEIEELSKKFNILPEYKKATKQLGKPIRHDSNKNYIIYGCVVRKTKDELFNFTAFAKCLFEVNKNNRKDLYEFVALQELSDSKDELLQEKIVTLLRFQLKKVNIHVCRRNTVYQKSDEPSS